MKIGKKTAVTKEITRQERNRRNNLKRLSISFIVAFILFIALVIIQSSILNQEKKVEVYQINSDIAVGTKIAEDNFDNYLALKEVNESLVPEGYVTDKTELIGKFTNRNYKAKDIITSDGVTDTEKLYKDSIKNPTVLSFSVGDASSAVAGSIHEGDYINIYGLRKDAFTNSDLKAAKENLVLKDDYFSFMHVYVAEAYDASGVRLSTDDKETQALMFKIILSEEDVVKFNEMLTNCNIKIAKILYDSDQTYLDFLQEINLEAGTIVKSSDAQNRKQYQAATDDIDIEPGTTDPVDYSLTEDEQAEVVIDDTEAVEGEETETTEDVTTEASETSEASETEVTTDETNVEETENTDENTEVENQ